MLEVDRTVLVVVDAQVKLMAAMHEKDQLIKNLVKLVKGAKVLNVPIIVTEQNPRGLGPTIPELAELIKDDPVISKLSFSCCGEEAFMAAFDKTERDQILICGMESHVCVYQTAADLLEQGYEVEVVMDAVSSRTPENRAIGWEKCKEYGASLTGVETVLFELLQVAEGPQFKEIFQIVK
jgi:nicotinamidase-related amidase